MVELHSHSNISDGFLSAEELIKLAERSGLKHLSITNHDTTTGIWECYAAGEKYNIKIIPGIEISAYDFKTDKKIHILGYLFDYKDNSLDEFCRELRERRNENSLAMLEKIINLGYKITVDEVKEYSKNSTGIFKQHIMHALMEKKYCDSIYSELYYELFGMNKGKALIPLRYLDVFEAIKAVKKAGGITVLAHPALSNCIDIIPLLKKNGLDGVEAYHTYQSEKDSEKIASIAKENDLLITSGSDYHGFYGKPEEILGKFSMDTEIIEMMEIRKNLN